MKHASISSNACTPSAARKLALCAVISTLLLAGPALSQAGTAPAPPNAANTSSISIASATLAATSPASTTPLNPAAPSTSNAAAPQSISATCVEHIPEGKERPPLSESFPLRGLSGHATWLRLKIKHGAGENVLPNGFEFQKDSDAAKALEAAGFVLPDARGPARVRVKHRVKAGVTESSVAIAVVPLPKEPGRKELVLPPLPIALARSSGEVVTLCSAPHTITVEDPIANQPDAKPRATLKPERQTEVWDALRMAVYGGLIGLALAGLAAGLFSWWRKRPKLLPPPPPPRPAWEVALESLHDIRQSRLVEQGRLDVHLERVSHTLRRYLGARYGFEGLESTSEEILDQLRGQSLSLEVHVDVRSFLSETDLVKFADVRPTEEQCHWALNQAETLVQRTLPRSRDLGAEGSANIERGLDDAIPSNKDQQPGGER